MEGRPARRRTSQMEGCLQSKERTQGNGAERAGVGVGRDGDGEEQWRGCGVLEKVWWCVAGARGKGPGQGLGAALEQ